MAETVGSSFCRGVGVCEHSNMQNYIDFTGSHFVEKNGGTLVSDLLAQRPLLPEMWNRSFPLQNGFCTFQGFQGRPRFFHITPLQNGPLYF